MEITTDLPPIQVDFRDVAEAAGLTAINVSGGKPVSVVDLATYLGDALGRKLRMRPVPMTLAR